MKSDITNNLTKFEINPDFDIEGYINIVKTAPTDIKPDTLLTLPKEIADHIKTSFSQNTTAISQKVSKIEIAWKMVEEKFLELSLSIFNLDDIPRYTYTCYPTTCPLIARDPERYRIAFPYNSGNKLACYVIAHELLHEFFYHHVYNIYSDKIDLNSRKLWDLSEVIAVLIMQDKEWIDLFSIGAEPYEIHKELLSKLKPYWIKNKNIQSLVQEFILNK